MSFSAAVKEVNPTAITWIFSHPVVDHNHPEEEFAALKEFADAVQYLVFHIVEHSKTGHIYIRGIARCFTQRSLLQLQPLLMKATLKPLRGMFTPLVVKDKLRSTNRIGDLIEFGSLAPRFKRSIECTGTCSHCCNPNKRQASN